MSAGTCRDPGPVGDLISPPWQRFPCCDHAYHLSGDPHALVGKGDAARADHDTEMAMESYDAAITANPDHPRAHLLITTRLEGLMEEEYLNRTGRFDPSSLSGEAADHYQQAVSDYNRAMMLDPTLTPVVTLRVLGKTRASVTHFQSMLDAM